MPRSCGCASGTCSCAIISSDGSIQISGTGSLANRYDLSAGNISLAGRLLVQDTATVDLTLNGTGTQADPLIVSADATLALGDLTNVDTADTSVGYVLARQGDGSFALDPPSTAPVGEINTDASLSGDGSAGDPLGVTDYDNIAWLEGAANSPNEQSLVLGSLTSEDANALRIQRQAPLGYEHTDSTVEVRTFNESDYQHASMGLFHDGSEVTRLRFGPTSSASNDPELVLEANGVTEFPIRIRTYTATAGSSGGGATFAETTVNFPSSRFESAPDVWIQATPGSSPISRPSATQMYVTSFYDLSASSVTVVARRADGGTISEFVSFRVWAVQ